ncbi:hypothetical protein M434DRAFT_45462, partial [Hypoxylon sp. CO27-5]
DNYRPPQGDFTFRVEPPPGLEPYDSYRPREREQRGPRHGRPHRNDDRRYQQRSQRNIDAGRRDHKKKKPSDRLLLIKKHDENPELMLGDAAGRVTYRDVDELSDSDETEMDISENSDSDAAEPARKRARTSDATTTKPEQEVPRWSNPDPYTALPPPDESSRKKKDMVQLIRKARVEADTKKPTPQIEGLDFISCDLHDNDSVDDNSGDRMTGNSQSFANSAQDTSSTRRGASSTTLPPKPRSLPAPHATYPNSTDHRRAAEGNKDNPIDLTASASLGNRKRNIDDTIKMPRKSKSAGKGRVSGDILPQWRPRDGNPCPWAVNDHRDTPSMATRLHKEIIDFYLWVRPRKFEEQVRGEMIKNLRTLIQKRWKDAELYPFGSFMSGLYLPTADMDIAICSERLIKNGSPKYDKKRHLWDLQTHLVYHRVPQNDEIEVIAKAKVPLVKYTDDKTSLKVDISFEKMDGYRAIKTFLDWKEKYPAMPILVSIIKHFLLMRGLNEPVNGGIGGFSVICMVVSLLDLMPQVQSRSMIPEHHLGEILMEFLDFYGNRFQYKTVAIRMNPPGLIPKSQISNFVYRSMDRLSILDPNNPENDIAGGSANAETILRKFSEAHAILKSRMAVLAWGGDGTILEPLFGGNYSIFQIQRDSLERLSQQS